MGFPRNRVPLDAVCSASATIMQPRSADESMSGQVGAAERGDLEHRVGITVSEDDASRGESLEEGTRQANSNLQRLIEAVGGLLAASGELLTRLQQILSGAQPASDGSDEAGPPPPTDRSE
jgi:hypothetical protein